MVENYSYKGREKKSELNYYIIFIGSILCALSFILAMLTYFPQVQEKLWQGVEFVINGEEAQRKPVIHYNLRRDL